MPNYREKCPDVWHTGRYFSAVADLAPGYIATMIQYGRLVLEIEEADDMDEVTEIVEKHKAGIKSKGEASK